MSVEQTPTKPATELKLPESITLGEHSFVVKDHPELQNLIITAGRIEKNKLYTKIEELQTGLRGLQQVQVVPPAEATTALKTELLEAVGDLIQKKIEPLLSMTGRIQADTLETYRQKLIDENAAVCIPELVKGNTKEELDASLAESIALRSRYGSGNVPFQHPNQKVTDPNIAQQMQEFNNGTAPAAQPAAAPITKPAPVPVPPAFPAAQPQQTEISKLTPEEFAARRESLEAEIKSLVN